MLTHAFDALKIEISKSPEISIFKRFRDQFFSLSHNESLNYYFIDFKSNDQDQVNNVIVKAKFCLIENTLSYRGDYKELLELTIVMLTKVSSNFKMQSPGALHKAR